MLRLFNTMTQSKEPFVSREDKKVKMYTCGPSIYRRPHIGNYRTFLYEDILQRYLEYLGYDVVRLVTLTDVEDKAIREAEREGVDLKDLTEGIADILFSEQRLLGIKTATYSPRSSTSVDQAVKLIKRLLEKGYAYRHRHEGRSNIYLDPLKFKEFGKLSRIDTNSWPKSKRRFHKDNYPGTPWNRGDFILWHGYKDGDKVHWDTDIGRGRSAWNVQDGAMVTKHLGFAVDIACGGIDNLVRHHDYNIAVIEGVSGEEFSRYWLHGEHLFVNGKKMSKSRGNVYYPKDLIEMGYDEKHIRFFLIYKHYRKRLNFTIEKFKKTSRELDTLRDMVTNLQKAESHESSPSADRIIPKILTSFEERMNDDLNVKSAFDGIFRIVKKLNILNENSKLGSKNANGAIRNLQKVDRVLRIIF
ncbi:MAG: class I tRNA ligase family protein [Candidatus Hodarchaeota archaeon]